MAKRFLNTELHNNPWFMNLEPKYKAFWHHILEGCNHGGIWQVNFQSAAFFVKAKLDPLKCKEVMKDHIMEIKDGKFWFIPGFINFQYGRELNPKNKVHQSVIELLKEFKITEKMMGLASPLSGAKDKEKDKAKAKVKENVFKSSSLKTLKSSKSSKSQEKSSESKIKGDKKKTSALQHFSTPALQHPLQAWINENAPEVAKMKKPLTAVECTRLYAEFSEDKLKGKLLEMENYQLLLSKYTSANLTLRNWLKLEQERKAERNPGRKYTRPADTRTTFK